MSHGPRVRNHHEEQCVNQLKIESGTRTITNFLDGCTSTFERADVLEREETGMSDFSLGCNSGTHASGALGGYNAFCNDGFKVLGNECIVLEVFFFKTLLPNGSAIGTEG